MTKDTDRHSEPVVTSAHKPLSPEQRAPLEAANGLRQFDRLIEMLDGHLTGVKYGRETFAVRPGMLMELARIAVDQLIENPGAYRQTPMKIRSAKGDARHEPPRWEDVPDLVDEMCEYVNQNWNKPALHLAAYLLWRVNWIHPFSDGNGRTARAISYLVLCVRLRQRLPGDRTMPDFISDEKSPYYSGLEAADAACSRGKIDVSALESYLRELLVQQVTQAASSGDDAAQQATTTQLKPDAGIVSALGEDRESFAKRHAAWIAAGGAIAVAIIAGTFALMNRPRCVEGAQQVCRCHDGSSGVQACHDGRFEACDCAFVAPVDAAVPSDAALLHGSAAPRD